MFKKPIVVVAIGLLFFNVASAQVNTSTNQDLFNLIKQLQTQIQSLQAKITDLQAEVQSVKLELKFNRALTQGATGNDVKQLQEFLKTFTGSYPDGSITGYFGPRTEAAVKKFQTQNGIESVGIVGPKTKEKLNVLAAAIPAVSAVPVSVTGTLTTPATPAIPPMQGGPTVSAIPCRTPTGIQIQPTSIKVISPNGGEQWQIGETYTIKYSAEKVAGNKALLIYLEKGYDAPSIKTGANSSLLIGVTSNLESYNYKIPQNIQSFPGLGSNYKIMVSVEGSVSYCNGISYTGDTSDATFSIVAGQNNVPGTSAGGYGQGQPSGLTNPANKTPTNTVGNGYLTTQEKMANIQAEINKLQNQLDTSNDTIAQAHLPSQIVALKGQLQILPVSAQIDTLHTKLEKATDDETKTSLRSQIDALKAQVGAILSQTQLKPIYVVPPPAVALTTQEKISGMQAQISAYQNKLDNTTDTSARDNLTTQIVTLKKIIQELQNSPTTPSTQPARIQI
jgi:peptidoglycan hydrolase-like protein with peptidoglycan-binding domain